MTEVISGPRPVDAAPPAAPPATPPAAVPPVTPPNDAGAVRAPGSNRRWWLGLPAAIIGLFMVALDQSMVGVASGAIGNTLGASTIDTQWVTTVNRVGQAIAIPAAAWTCKRFGLRTMYVTAMVLYIVFSVASVFAPTLWTLAACRFLEGIPGGIVAIAAIGVLITTVPMPMIPTAIPILQAFVLCAPGFGPALGGLLVLDVQWRSVFWATAALAVIGLFASLALPQRPRTTAPPPFDLTGFACLAGSVIAFTLGVSKGNDWGWTSYPILILFLVSVDLGVLFVIIERQAEHPLLNMGMFVNRTFAVGLVLTAVIGVELAAPLTFIPTYLKSVQGLSATDAGMVMIPQALVLVAAVVLAQTLVRTWGLRPTMATGLPLLAVGDLLLSRLSVDTPRVLLGAILCVRAAGLGLAFVPILSGATSTLKMPLIPDAIQFRTIIQRIVGAVLVTGLLQVANHRQRQILDDQSGLLSPADQPGLYAQNQSTPTSSISLWNQLKFHGTAQSYGEMFLVAGLLAVAAIVLVFITRWGKPPGSNDVVVRDGG